MQAQRLHSRRTLPGYFVLLYRGGAPFHLRWAPRGAAPDYKLAEIRAGVYGLGVQKKYSSRTTLVRPEYGLVDRSKTLAFTQLGGLHHCIGKEISRFEQGKDDFIENIDDACIRYDRGRVAANRGLIAEIRAQGLRKTTRQTGLDRKTIRAILNGKKMTASTLAKVVIGLRSQ